MRSLPAWEGVRQLQTVPSRRQMEMITAPGSEQRHGSRGECVTLRRQGVWGLPGGNEDRPVKS